MTAPTAVLTVTQRYLLRDLKWEKSQAVTPGRVMLCKGRRSGLQRVRGGFVTTDQLSPELYSFSTIRALRDRGLVNAWGGGGNCPMVVHITERGERTLAEWSEARARKAPAP